MGVRGLARAAAVVAAGLVWIGLLSSGAWASVTPGWECVPTTAGQAVVSGGTGSAPSCAAGTTAVLAPTYVSSGVGGKPTAEFSAVNVQILNGAGSTASNNGSGNLVLGYDESPGTQTGSHNLVLGQKQTYTGFADLIGGLASNVTANYDAAFGYVNKLTGSYALIAGDQNTVSANESSALGGYHNVVSRPYSALLGGCSNLVGTGTVSPSSLCSDITTYNHDFATISGGMGNLASGITSSISGGQSGTASGAAASVSGGNQNTAEGSNGAWAAGGFSNLSNGSSSSAVGGTSNSVTSDNGVVLGGSSNSVTGLNAIVSGGSLNRALGDWAEVSGGDHNTADGTSTGALVASVFGGGGNVANGDESSIVGGQYNTTTDDDSLVAGGCDNIAGAGSAPTGDCVSSFSGLKDGHDVVLGGLTNATTGLGSATAGGEFNSAFDPFSMIAGGCDNITGSGTASTNSCDAGGEGVSGGKSLSATDQDQTYGHISDGINFGGTLSFNVPANTCGVVNASTPGTKVGDVPDISFTNALPLGLFVQPLTIATANQMPLGVCNTTASQISFSNQAVHLMTFR